jgi:hypothetical protein
MIFTPSSAKIPSNARVNLPSRSRMRKRREPIRSATRVAGLLGGPRAVRAGDHPEDVVRAENLVQVMRPGDFC